MALRDRYGEALSWTRWPADLARRDPAAIAAARSELRDDVDYWRFVQWCFDREWMAVRAAGAARGIRIVGDMPIFVAHDSADVWATPRPVRTDDGDRPRVVAGVPPDYFSATGQLWGNPLYRWDRHAAGRLRVVDRRGCARRCGSWTSCASITSAASPRTGRVPAAATTAVDGRWVRGPGAARSSTR